MFPRGVKATTYVYIKMLRYFLPSKACGQDAKERRKSHGFVEMFFFRALQHEDTPKKGVREERLTLKAQRGVQSRPLSEVLRTFSAPANATS